MQKKRVLGLIGSIGSGKGIVGERLMKKYGFQRVMMGNLVRAVARKKNVKITRKNLQKLGKSMREKYGNDYYINIAIEKIKKSKKQRFFIDGLRFLEDTTTPKKEVSMKIIKVDAKPEIRFKRLQKRGREGFPENVKEFKFYEKNEPGYSQLKKTLKYVDYTIKNNSTEKELHKRIDFLMCKLKIK